MKTQREAQAEHVNYLLPPVSLTFTLSQTRRDRCLIDVRAYSGNHCFVHRQLDTWYDSFQEIPALVGSSLLSWTLWLVQFEAERRQLDPGRPPGARSRFPDWPAREPLSGRHSEVGF